MEAEDYIRRERNKALKEQVGGTHYKDLTIQPVEYIMANNLPWCEGNVVKLITRYKAKGGKQDLEKIIHYVNILLETHYKEKIIPDTPDAMAVSSGIYPTTQSSADVPNRLAKGIWG